MDRAPIVSTQGSANIAYESMAQHVQDDYPQMNAPQVWQMLREQTLGELAGAVSERHQPNGAHHLVALIRQAVGYGYLTPADAVPFMKGLMAIYA